MSRMKSAIEHIKTRWRRTETLNDKLEELNARLTTLSTAYEQLQGEIKQGNFAPYTPTPDLGPLFTPTPPIEMLAGISMTHITAKRMSTPRNFSGEIHSRSFSF